MIVNRPDGNVGLDARSGSLEGGASGFVNAHAGFGVFLGSDTFDLFTFAISTATCATHRASGLTRGTGF